jgi:DNA replication protein DnaC
MALLLLVLPLDQNMRLALLQILEDRHSKKPTIVAPQLPVSDWHNYFGDPTLADTIMDIITANAHRIDLKGNSLRDNRNF